MEVIAEDEVNMSVLPVLFQLFPVSFNRALLHPERPASALTFTEDVTVFYRSTHSEHAQDQDFLGTETLLVIGQQSGRSFK